MSKLRGIESVGFDLDGTLYKSTSEMNDRVRTQIAFRLMDKYSELGDVENARAFFETRYKVLNGGTKVLEEAGYIDAVNVMDDCLARADVLDLIHHDKNLVGIMRGISLKYEMNLLTSSPHDLALSKLERLGINPVLFDEIICSDNPNAGSKISGDAFDYMLTLSHFPSSQHVYVGDRKGPDIFPARERGMKTISVWSDIPEADFSVKTINNIEGLLL
jgi:FMN phosphatase YigB (HAD superfamily)